MCRARGYRQRARDNLEVNKLAYPKGIDVMQEESRSLLFHWVANMFFAGIALFSGVLFGLKVPADKAVLIVVVGALVLIPVTRRWERTGIQKRQEQSGEATGDNSPETSG